MPESSPLAVPASPPLGPGAVLGMLGGGQLGRMFADAAHELGYKVHVFSPVDGEPACQVADFKTIAAYDDFAALERFAASVAAVSYEFENVPAATAAACLRHAPVRPGERVLHTCQHRLREKAFFASAGIPSGKWAKVATEDDLRAAVATCGVPAVMKTAGGGYDGKGQRAVKSGGFAEALAAWDALKRVECIYEAFVPCVAEVSVVAARGVSGKTVCYGPILNTHTHHILDLSIYPAPDFSDATKAEAVRMATRAMDALGVVGVLCIELFVMKDGSLLANEMAPRPHNSGHLTINAFRRSQFHQQVLTLCGFDPAEPGFVSPAAMSNLLGDVWEAAPGGKPDFAAAAQVPGVSVHLYGKAEARPGRKMGHLTALAATPEAAADAARLARERLTGK